MKMVPRSLISVKNVFQIVMEVLSQIKTDQPAFIVEWAPQFSMDYVSVLIKANV